MSDQNFDPARERWRLDAVESIAGYLLDGQIYGFSPQSLIESAWQRLDRAIKVSKPRDRAEENRLREG
jgi:hypothetical protein